MLAVLTFHVALYSGGLDGTVVGDTIGVAGYLGPPVFFAISGFLLYRPFVAARIAGRDGPSVRRFGRRRVLRIVPAYWFVLTILAVFPGIVGVFTGDWWRYYGFLQLYRARTVGAGMPVAWTLCVEVTFYLALPVWAQTVGRAWRARPRREVLVFVVAAGAGAIIQAASARQAIPWLAGQTLLGQFPWFAIGMALAVISAVHPEGPAARARWSVPRPEVLWGVAALAAAGLVANSPAGGALALLAESTSVRAWHTIVVKLVLTGVFVLAIITPAVFDRSVGVAHRVLSTRPLALLGVISYSAYLWHLIIIQLLARGSDPSHFRAAGLGVMDHVHVARTPILWAMTVAATVVVATLSYRFVELPFLARKEGGRLQLFGDQRRLAAEQPDAGHADRHEDHGGREQQPHAAGE